MPGPYLRRHVWSSGRKKFWAWKNIGSFWKRLPILHNAGSFGQLKGRGPNFDEEKNPGRAAKRTALG